MTQRVDDHWQGLGALRAAGIEDLMALHYEALAPDKLVLPYDPDWPTLHVLFRNGQLKLLGAWSDNELVGYMAYEVFAPRLSRNVKMAHEVGLYVLPEHRGFLGIALLAMAEKLLRQDGVILAGVSSRAAHAHTGDLLVKLGYRPDEVIHTKVL